MRRLVYLTAARDDLADILRYIADESRDATIAHAFVGKIMDHCDRLASLPGMLGTPRPELRAEIRSIPPRGYVIFFRYAAEQIQIVNVLSASRDVDRHFE